MHRTTFKEHPGAQVLLVNLAYGTRMTMNIGDCLSMHVDLNPKRKEMVYMDLYSFYFCTDPVRRVQYFNDANKVFGPGRYYNRNFTREQARAECKARGAHCSQLLMMDGCEFKKDYPQKLN